MQQDCDRKEEASRDQALCSGHPSGGETRKERADQRSAVLVCRGEEAGPQGGHLHKDIKAGKGEDGKNRRD